MENKAILWSKIQMFKVLCSMLKKAIASKETSSGLSVKQVVTCHWSIVIGFRKYSGYEARFVLYISLIGNGYEARIVKRNSVTFRRETSPKNETGIVTEQRGRVFTDTGIVTDKRNRFSLCLLPFGYHEDTRMGEISVILPSCYL